MKLLAVVVALGSLAACGKKGSTADDKASSTDIVETGPVTPATPVASAEPAADNRCEVTVEGDIKDHGFGPGGSSAVGTDYWMSDEELRKALEMMAGAFGDKHPDLDAEMKKDPRLYTLLINCQTPRTKISLLPSSGTKYADVPFGPKKYKITEPQSGKAPGQIHTMVNFEDVKGVFNIDGEGELDITKFDKTGIAGSFHFDMVERQWGTPTAAPKKAKLKGTFNFKCSLGTSVCQEGAK